MGTEQPDDHTTREAEGHSNEKMSLIYKVKVKAKDKMHKAKDKLKMKLKKDKVTDNGEDEEGGSALDDVEVHRKVWLVSFFWSYSHIVSPRKVALKLV